MRTVRAEIAIGGIVQGVGFRPYVHRLVTSLNLGGTVRNTATGVELILEGEEAAVQTALSELKDNPPPLALIESISTDFSKAPQGLNGFSILDSSRDGAVTALVSPDMGICQNCLRELSNPLDRRYRYPFINCTDCGPRFTITKRIPYDRKNTSMSVFPMCGDCSGEYGDIGTRRYHAQPDCCQECGPSLLFYNSDGVLLSSSTKNDTEPDSPLSLARQVLLAHGILAVKGIGGIHLACLAEDDSLVSRLRARKRRERKPFALMVKSVEDAGRFCSVSPAESALLEDPRRPIVLLPKKDPSLYSEISENGYVGIMLPYTPLHALLFEKGIRALVMTSANLSDLPVLSDNETALKELRGIADAFLLHNREIVARCDDSLVYCHEEKPYFVRRSRGFVPRPVSLPLRAESVHSSVLACGAEQKASFTLTKGNRAFLSQHVGDLKNAETLAFYASQEERFRSLFEITPEAVACDLHPDYLSTVFATDYASSKGLPLYPVQHHHAHMVSCMADNGLTADCIGIIWDGTGYGPDGTSWGGEILTGGYKTYARAASLLPMRLPGGDAAIRQTDRMGISLLLSSGIAPEAIPPEMFPKATAARVSRQLAAGINCPVSTGMGRLFDGVSAILGICTDAAYEGRGAILLQAECEDPVGYGALPYSILSDSDGILRMDWRPVVRALFDGILSGIPRSRLAAEFVNTLAFTAAEMAVSVREVTGLSDVVLSGGTFQNLPLLSLLQKCLQREGFCVYHHQQVSCNDEGLSFGQAVIALNGGENYVPCSTPAHCRAQR